MRLVNVRGVERRRAQPDAFVGPQLGAATVERRDVECVLEEARIDRRTIRLKNRYESAHCGLGIRTFDSFARRPCPPSAQ